MQSRTFKTFRLQNERNIDLSDHHPCHWVVDGITGVQYNVQFLFRQVGESDEKNKVGKKDPKAIQEFVNQMVTGIFKKVKPEPDVLCLNEVFDNVAWKLFKKALGEKGYYLSRAVGTPLFGEPTLHGGLMTFVKSDSVRQEAQYVYQHKTGGPFSGGDALVDKGVKACKFTRKNKTFHVFNSHCNASYIKLDSTGTNELPQYLEKHYIEVTLAQVAELRLWIDSLRGSHAIVDGETVIIAGDFNIPFDSIKRRNPALSKRMQIILGAEYARIKPTDDSIPSYNPSQNTWLKGKKDAEFEGDSMLDVAFAYDANVTKEPDALRKWVIEAQFQLSRWVENKESPNLIERGSMLLDKMIDAVTVGNTSIHHMKNLWHIYTVYAKGSTYEAHQTIDKAIDLAASVPDVTQACKQNTIDEDIRLKLNELLEKFPAGEGAENGNELVRDYLTSLQTTVNRLSKENNNQLKLQAIKNAVYQITLPPDLKQIREQVEPALAVHRHPSVLFPKRTAAQNEVLLDYLTKLLNRNYPGKKEACAALVSEYRKFINRRENLSIFDRFKGAVSQKIKDIDEVTRVLEKKYQRNEALPAAVLSVLQEHHIETRPIHQPSGS
jgi:hypothetical protein